MERSNPTMSHVKVEPGVWSLLDGTRQMEARVSRQGDDYLVTVRGRQIQIRVEDPRDSSNRNGGRADSSMAKVLSLMPGKVVRVMVAPGDLVEKGQGLVVVEAMKMQNEMKSPLAGIVQQVQAEVGATVMANQILVLVVAKDAG